MRRKTGKAVTLSNEVITWLDELKTKWADKNIEEEISYDRVLRKMKVKLEKNGK